MDSFSAPEPKPGELEGGLLYDDSHLSLFREKVKKKRRSWFEDYDKPHHTK